MTQTEKKCTNAEPGNYGHECGKPARWIASKSNGYKSTFCDQCKSAGSEARFYSQWTQIKEQTQ